MREDVHVHPRLARPALSASPNAHGRCHSPVAHSVGRDILDGTIVGRCVEPQEFFTPIAVQTKRDITELLARSRGQELVPTFVVREPHQQRDIPLPAGLEDLERRLGQEIAIDDRAGQKCIATRARSAGVLDRQNPVSGELPELRERRCLQSLLIPHAELFAARKRGCLGPQPRPPAHTDGSLKQPAR